MCDIKSYYVKFITIYGELGKHGVLFINLLIENVSYKDNTC
jgi:hypothetical protein